MRNGISCLVAVTILAVVATDTRADLIKNGQFDTPDVGGALYVTYKVSPGGFEWVITQAPGNSYGVDAIGSMWPGIGGPLNSVGYDQSVDIDYNNSISQSFATVPGASYDLSLFYSHHFQRSSSTGFVTVTGTGVLVDETLVHDLPTSAVDMMWLQFTRTFVADSTVTTLTIAGSAGNGTRGFAVDNVSVMTMDSCGDGIPDPGNGEQCDDGNGVCGDGCDPNCMLSACGNEFTCTDSGESCDDGNITSCDDCDENCQVETPSCGDNQVDPCEECDGTNDTSCPGQCLPPGHPNECMCAPECSIFPLAGPDNFETIAVVTVQISESLTDIVELSGPTVIERGDPYDPGDGRREIPTEIVSMLMTGTSGVLGDLRLIESPTLASQGNIKARNAGSDFPADSFFDVFFEIETTLPAPLDRLHNLDPLRMRQVIDCIPPVGVIYQPPPGVQRIPLFNVQGTEVATLVHAQHEVITPFCGDGVQDPWEDCDDGNTVDCDGCDRNCKLPSCGNGIICDPEECDGLDLGGDTCETLELGFACGVLACTTECTLDTTGCTALPCTWCGDAILQEGEECDNGDNNSNEPNRSCRTDCTRRRCGDNIGDDSFGEQCDGTDDEACRAQCLPDCTCKGCAVAPVEGCVGPAKGVLLVKEKVAGKEKLKVVLKKLKPAVEQNRFGDPVAGTTDYAVCVYDESDVLIGRMIVERAQQTCGPRSKACWKAISDTGYKYKDPDTIADGILKIVAKGGDAGKGKVIVIGKNNEPKGQTSLRTGIAALLQDNTKATVQVVTSDADCFGVSLDTVKKADNLMFKALGGSPSGVFIDVTSAVFE